MCYVLDPAQTRDMQACTDNNHAFPQIFDANESGKVSQTEVHDAVLRIFTCVLVSCHQAARMAPGTMCTQRDSSAGPAIQTCQSTLWLAGSARTWRWR